VKPVKAPHRPLLLAALILAVGCKDHPNPIKFNNTLARANRELSQVGPDFAAAARKDPPDPREVETKWQAMASKVKAIKEQFDDIGSPMGASYGSELLSRYLDFLQAEEAIVNGPAKEIVQIVKGERAVPDPKAAINELIAKIGSDESAKLTPLLETQKKYAEDLKLKFGR
jgi:hypothetical protein